MQNNLLKDKKVLILGGGIMQMPIIRCAKKNGMFVSVMDKNCHAPALHLADEKIFSSIGDCEKAWQSIEKPDQYCQKFDGIVTVGTDFSTTVAFLAGKLNLPNVGFDVALRCTDKKIMRETLRKAGIFQPLCMEVNVQQKKPLEKEDIWYDAVADEWENYCQKNQKNVHLATTLPTYPAVVKPVDSMGARGVVRVSDREQLKRKLDYVADFSPSKRIIVEQFLVGKGEWCGELSIDALVFQKNIIITGVADRMISHAPFFVEDGHIIPSQRSKKIVDASIDVFKKAIRAVGIKNGAAKGDIILTDEGPTMGEIAARLSGGFMSGYTYPLSSGVDLMEKMLLVACGYDPNPILEQSLGVVLECALHARPGIVRRVRNVQLARSMDGVKHLFIHAQSGTKVEVLQNNVMKCGNAIIFAENVDSVMKIAQKVKETIFFEIKT